MKEVLARDVAEKLKADNGRAAREAEKSCKLAASQTDEVEIKSKKTSKKSRKKAAAASSGLSFEVDDE
jgi:hypothetical protein